MVKVKCDRCREEVDVALYLYNAKIEFIRYLPSDPEDYRAAVDARATCPVCGGEIRKHFAKLVGRADIIKLAVGKGGEEE